MISTQTALRMLADKCLIIGRDLESGQCTVNDAKERLERAIAAALERLARAMQDRPA